MRQTYTGRNADYSRRAELNQLRLLRASSSREQLTLNQMPSRLIRRRHHMATSSAFAFVPHPQSIGKYLSEVESLWMRPARNWPTCWLR